MTCLQSWRVVLELEGTVWNTVNLNLTLVVTGYILGDKVLGKNHNYTSELSACCERWARTSYESNDPHK